MSLYVVVLPVVSIRINENEKDYYPLNLKGEIVYARVRAIIEYTNNKKAFLVFNFEKPYSKKVEIYSKKIGQLKNKSNDNQYYGVEIKNIQNIKKDTVYINTSDKSYKFYHD